jgi:hypothetical protein
MTPGPPSLDASIRAQGGAGWCDASWEMALPSIGMQRPVRSPPARGGVAQDAKVTPVLAAFDRRR